MITGNSAAKTAGHLAATFGPPSGAFWMTGHPATASLVLLYPVAVMAGRIMINTGKTTRIADPEDLPPPPGRH